MVLLLLLLHRKVFNGCATTVTAKESIQWFCQHPAQYPGGQVSTQCLHCVQVLNGCASTVQYSVISTMSMVVLAQYSDTLSACGSHDNALILTSY